MNSFYHYKMYLHGKNYVDLMLFDSPLRLLWTNLCYTCTNTIELSILWYLRVLCSVLTFIMRVSWVKSCAVICYSDSLANWISSHLWLKNYGSGLMRTIGQLCAIVMACIFKIQSFSKPLTYLHVHVAQFFWCPRLKYCFISCGYTYQGK